MMVRFLKRVILSAIITAAIVAALMAVALQFQGGRDFFSSGSGRIADLWKNLVEGGDMTLEDLGDDSPDDSFLHNARKNTEAFQDKIDKNYQDAIDAVATSPTPQ
ncbi:MAG: hypothetical protein P9L99_02200 [Candidatus Lernaella stagnicola]|nr:hypothetical protein [Candidatus Lernaella stagnicola]